MYSIILKLKSDCGCGCGMNPKPSTKERWKYLTNSDGSIYQEDDLENVRLKCIELLSDNLLSSIKVVQNKGAQGFVQIEGAPDPHVSVLPTVTDADNGKVLMVIEGEWGVSEIEVLPNVTLSDNGKILKVVDGVWTVADEVVNTDSKVTQTNVTTNGEYRVLLSKQTDDAEHTDTVLKSGQFIYNPYENHMNVIKNTDNLYTESHVSDDSLGVFNWDKTNNIRKSLRVEYDDITLSNQTWDGTNASLKNALAAASGGTELPATTSADNGKVLKVIEGSWGKGVDEGSIIKNCVYGIGTEIFSDLSPYYDDNIYILIPKDKWSNNVTNFAVQNQVSVDSGTGLIILTTHANEYFWQLSKNSTPSSSTDNYFISVNVNNENNGINAQSLSTKDRGIMIRDLLPALSEQYTPIGVSTTYQLTSTVITSQQVQNMWDNIFSPTEEEVNNE